MFDISPVVKVVWLVQGAKGVRPWGGAPNPVYKESAEADEGHPLMPRGHLLFFVSPKKK